MILWLSFNHTIEQLHDDAQISFGGFIADNGRYPQAQPLGWHIGIHRRSKTRS